MHKNMGLNYFWVSFLFFIVGVCASCDGLSENQRIEIFVAHEFPKDSIIQKLNVFKDFSEFSIAVIDGDSTSFIGARIENGHLVPVQNNNAIFGIGSISKVFTSLLFSQFVVDNKISLNSNISDYCSGNQYLDDIELIHLSNHTSGLPRIPDDLNLFASDPYKDYSETKLVNYLKTTGPLKNAAGANFEYSNLGAGLLGYILTRISGLSYEELLQKHIFQPYGMKSSTSIANSQKQDVVNCKDANGNVIPSWTFDVLAPAGAVFSSSADLSIFIRNNFDENSRVLSLMRRQTFEIDGATGVGLGWLILKQEDSSQVFYHNGSTNTHYSVMLFNPKTKKGVVVLSNLSALTSNLEVVELVAHQLFDSL